VLKALRSSARWLWGLMFLMGIGFAMTLVTSGGSQIAPPLLTCRASAVQSPRGFPRPQVRQSLSGLLRTTFTACISPQVMLDQNQVPPVMATFNPPTFEGTIPAPTLLLKPGDKLSLLMVNSLPANLPGERAGAFPHAQNTFNFHAHGLTVSPLGISDNIFREMDPGTAHLVEINIPQDHPSGTFWYHVHKHGSGTVQINSGMAGFLIVQGGPGTLDAVPEVAAAKDVPMAFQVLRSLSDGRVVFVHQQAQQYGTFPFPGWQYYPPTSFLPLAKDQGIWSTYGLDSGFTLEPDGKTLAPPSRFSYTTNGVANPTLTMQPGEVQRWRLLNASDGDNLQLALVPQANPSDYTHGLGLNVVALDGITLPRTYALAAAVNGLPNPLVIGPAQRADVMVKAPSAPGVYLLQALDNNSNFITASVSPYRDSNFPRGITPAGQPSRRGGNDFPGPCPAPGLEPSACLPQLPPLPPFPPYAPAGFFNYPVTLATIVVLGPPKNMNLPADPLPTPKGLPSIATMLSTTPNKVRNIVFELCGGVTETAVLPPSGPDIFGNFKNLYVNIPSCPWYFAKYNAMYWGGTPFITLQMMRDADDVGQPTHDPNMPLANFKKEGLFDPLQPLFPDMIAGNYEEWTVYNRSFSTHPWHLHQNHVLITKINGVTLPLPEWHDTLLVPAASSPCYPAPPSSALRGQRRRGGPAAAGPGLSAPLPPPDPTDTCLGPPNNINNAIPGSITFRVYFNPITVGCFVAHCHIIDHEDLGMMQRFDIRPAAGQPSGCGVDVAEQQPNLKKRLAMKDNFEICTGSAPGLASRKQQYSADAEWWKPDLR
jgi:FtsP/CotA-like multicopper oxidase with cupredoxin domain